MTVDKKKWKRGPVLSKEAATKLIRDAAEAGRVELCDQYEIDAFPESVIHDFLSRVFDVQRALLTDESQISDFVGWMMDPDARRQARLNACIRIRELYGVECSPDDYIWQVLKRIHGKGGNA